MFVMSVADFMELSSLAPHQELLAEHKVVPWNASMSTVFFVSHEWTSFTHPDHSLDQSRALKTLLIRMLRGECPQTSPSFAHAVYLPSDVSVSPAEWQSLVRGRDIGSGCVAVSAILGRPIVPARSSLLTRDCPGTSAHWLA